MAENKLLDAKRLIGGFVTAALFAGVLVYIMRYLGEDFGTRVVEIFGLPGVFFGLLFIDTIPTPGGSIPILTLAMQGGLSPIILGCISLSACYCAGFIGFYLGQKWSFPKTWREKLEQKYPNAFARLHKHEGSSFLVLVALPIPMSLAAWIGSSFSLTFRAFCFGALVRIPKIILYLMATYSSVQLLGSESSPESGVSNIPGYTSCIENLKLEHQQKSAKICCDKLGGSWSQNESSGTCKK